MKKKLMSLVLAMTMILSAFPAASAVNAEPLSEYAGMTVPVQVVEETENGLESHLIRVTIPKNATEGEASTLISAASSSNGVSTYSTAGTDYVLSTLRGYVVEDEPKKVGGGIIPVVGISSITVIFDIGRFDHSGERLLVQLRNMDNPSISINNEWKSIVIMQDAWEVVFRSSQYVMSKGTDVGVYAKTFLTGGYINLLSTTVIANGL